MDKAAELMRGLARRLLGSVDTDAKPPRRFAWFPMPDPATLTTERREFGIALDDGTVLAGSVTRYRLPSLHAVSNPKRPAGGFLLPNEPWVREYAESVRQRQEERERQARPIAWEEPGAWCELRPRPGTESRAEWEAVGEMLLRREIRARGKREG